MPKPPNSLDLPRRVLARVSVCATLLFGGYVVAWAQAGPTAPIDPYASRVPPGSVLETAQSETPLSGNFEEAVRFEREVLERQAERHVSSLVALFDRAVWLFTAILTLAGAVLIWQFGSSRKELHRSLTASMKEKAEEIVESEANALRRRYESLRDQVEAFLSYQDRSIAWVMREEDAANSDILERIYASGFRNIRLVTPQTGQPFEIGSPDLVVISYDGSDEGLRRLQIVIDAGLDRSEPFPLLVYTFNHGRSEIRLEEEELALLGTYKWYLPVNFPVQLVSQISSLLRRPKAVGPVPI